MRIHEVRELSNDQLYEELEKSSRELMNLRFRAATNQLTDTNEPNSVKKTIARLQTVIKERQIQEAS
ncbi:MAG: 50S ribosomal protein L29 [SAR202 cluster bacterium]|nr:50S ribosomal protein L29 [Chloroflexota bacterium]MQF94682.1 50S ribosomal protein L29 [SAR202 cluster bacterium]HAA95553.1 50S ribosomal protein L29 [Dehalococcoidia bacterium]MBO19654.1 50S ribosomal protein L29 [Chloroflexota bacterium]MQG34081.1 50S ribosomal protein L29 [SAR202 cluster bacterium]|tara:strand:- start:63 stop:263 length:201 start_codon:yes stop_codon:yes gene_type:complete